MTLEMLLQDTRDDALKEGMEKGKKEGLEEGRKESNLCSVKNLMKNLKISLEQAMTVLNLSTEDRDYCQKALAPAAG